MEQVFENRADCLQSIRASVGDDAWAARYVLLTALQELDLQALNVVRLAAEQIVDDAYEDRRRRLQLLLQERWG